MISSKVETLKPHLRYCYVLSHHTPSSSTHGPSATAASRNSTRVHYLASIRPHHTFLMKIGPPPKLSHLAARRQLDYFAHTPKISATQQTNYQSTRLSAHPPDTLEQMNRRRNHIFTGPLSPTPPRTNDLVDFPLTPRTSDMLGSDLFPRSLSETHSIE